jgi:hypothetical protein
MKRIVHRHLKIIAFNANGIRGQAHEVRKDLRIHVALFSETYLKPHLKMYIPNYDIYRTSRQDGHKGGTIEVRKGVSHTAIGLPLLISVVATGVSIIIIIITLALQPLCWVLVAFSIS